MFQHNLSNGVKLYDMMTQCPRIRSSVLNLIKRVINLIHAEQYDPASVEFMTMAPQGEPNKIVIVLEKASYMDRPLIEAEIHPSDSSYQLTGFVNSLYKAIMGENGALEGFINVCPGLASLAFAVANYILMQWYALEARDIHREIVWDSFDWWITQDLLITGSIK